MEHGPTFLNPALLLLNLTSALGSFRLRSSGLYFVRDVSSMCLGPHTPRDSEQGILEGKLSTAHSESHGGLETMPLVRSQEA